jgi:hypothetical protein
VTSLLETNQPISSSYITISEKNSRAAVKKIRKVKNIIPPKADPLTNKAVQARQKNSNLMH